MPASAAPRVPRRLIAVSVPPGAPGAIRVANLLGPALDGSGPAIAPIASEPATIAQETISVFRPDDPTHPLENDDIAVVCATSGSTGRPRGVLLTQQAIVASARAFGERFGTSHRWVLAMPAHRIAGIMVLARSWLHGNPYEIDPSIGGARRFEAPTFAATTAKALRAGDGRPLAVSLVPTQLARLIDAGSVGVDALLAYDLVLSGAATTPQPLLEKLRALGVKITVSYGMSETCGGCVFDGKPLSGVRIELVGGRDDEPARIAISGSVLSCGYRLRPDLDGVSYLDRKLVTNDVGQLDAQGLLHVLGRLDDVVTVGGVNVALSAVEAAIRHHPLIEDVAIVDYPDDLWGSIPIAYLVTRAKDQTELVTQLRNAVRERIGPAAVPRQFIFVDQLPMLDSGKIDRLGLRVRTLQDVADGRIAHPGNE